MTKKKVLIATGGTGGHIFPAISLANFLENNNYKVKVTTDRRGLKFFEGHPNLDLIEIPSSPLVKKNVLKIALSILIIFYSLLKSLIFLTFNRPSIIFGMGGYSSFPICIIATFLRIKFVIYENNLIIGKANKYLLPFAKKIFVSFKELDGVSKNYNNKVIEIGNIIREEIINTNYSYDEKRKFDKIKILVLGGSQAAKIFAEELPQVFKKIAKSELPIKVYQQCQKKQNTQLKEFYKKTGIEHEIFNFTDKINNYYTKTNLVITRAGASALGELINVKTPFISIPLPSSADNHQYKNAEFYEKKGYGYLLEEKNIKSELYGLIKSIFYDKSLVKSILSKQEQHSDKDIFGNLNNQLEKILDEKN